MAIHNWAKDQYLNQQPSERPNMFDVAGPVSHKPVMTPRPNIKSTKPQAPPGQPVYGPHIGYNTGGLVSLVI